MIKLLLKHNILDKCIDTFFNSIANNFQRAMVEGNIKYAHVNVRNIPMRSEAQSYYGVTFHTDSNGKVDPYRFTFDKYIHRYFFRSRKEASDMLAAMKATPFFNDPDIAPERTWIDEIHDNLSMLCFDKSHYKTTELNPDYYSVEVIR